MRTKVRDETKKHHSHSGQIAIFKSAFQTLSPKKLLSILRGKLDQNHVFKLTAVSCPIQCCFGGAPYSDCVASLPLCLFHSRKNCAAFKRTLMAKGLEANTDEANFSPAPKTNLFPPPLDPYNRTTHTQLPIFVCDGEKRIEALRTADIFRARVVDSTIESFIFEVTGSTDKVDAFVELMVPLGMANISRTGSAALSRGTRKI